MEIDSRGVYSLLSGYTDEAGTSIRGGAGGRRVDPRAYGDARGPASLPDVARARTPRADRIRVVRGAAVAAVDGESSLEDAGRCRLGHFATRRHQSLLQHVARRTRHWG